MTRFSRLLVRHRWWTVGSWVALVLGIQILSMALGGASYKDDFKLPGTESQTVADLFSKAGLAQQNNPSGTLVLRAKTGDLASEPDDFLRRAAAAVCDDGAAHIAFITTPWGTADCAGEMGAPPGEARPDLLSPDKIVAIVEVAFDVATPSDATPKVVYDDLKTLRSDDLQIEFTGDTFTAVDAGGSAISPELIGFLAAFVILGIVFRTLGATVLPLVTAAAGLGSGLGVLTILSHGMSVASFAPALATLMVIGVGVDYALFIVTRHRRNLLRGMTVEDSILSALGTSGRAVLFAGITVCIALLGLCALGVSFLYGVAIGTSIGVALTMLAALTLLPALLSLLGMRALPRSKRGALRSDRTVKILLCVVPPVCFLFWVLYGLQWALRPVLARNAEPTSSERQPFWSWWAHQVQRRSVVFGLLAATILVVVALPFFSLRLGHADQSNDPAGSTSREGYDLIQDAYGKGYNSALQLVLEGDRAGDQAFLDTVTATLATVPDVDRDSITAIPVTDDIAMIGFKSVSGPQDAATDTLVRALRDDVLPPLYDGTGTSIYVYGNTAVFIDFSAVLASKMAFFILAVVGLSFLLLMVAFRSIVIPLTAAAMNLLAAGASFGVVVAIFQWGWLGDQLGVGAGGPIDAFLPVLFFAILFGLSMDYQVFLVSRMHEEWVHTRDNPRSVTVGQTDTGGIITAAGIIMIAVFGGFVLGDDRTIKLLGIGLASAVFLDAFIVRTMLVPAIMHRVGAANWWYPEWLSRITPHMSIEPPDHPAGTGDDAPSRPRSDATVTTVDSRD